MEDMGIAKNTQQDAGITQTSHLVGTPYFMSTEQAQANGLLSTLARAYNNIGAKLDDKSSDLHSARSFYLRATDIYTQIGDVESLLFTMINIYQSSIDLGELQTVEEDVELLLDDENF